MNRGSDGANECGLRLKNIDFGLIIGPRLGLTKRGWGYTNKYGLLAF